MCIRDSIDMLRTAAVAISPQIGGDHGVVARQDRGDTMPGDVGLRVSMEQKQGRTAPAYERGDRRTFGLDIVTLESFKHGSCPASFDRCLVSRPPRDPPEIRRWERPDGRATVQRSMPPFTNAAISC